MAATKNTSKPPHSHFITGFNLMKKSYTNDERLAFARMIEHSRPDDVIHESSWANIGPGTVIGRDGFGHVRQEDGTLIKMPHRGNVVIEENVEIGANCCIDRAVMGSTVIGAGTKIDNLVHVAHGVKIGKGCLIVAGTVLGGSCEIGDNTFVGMNVSVKQKVSVGKGCTIGAGAVVLQDVPDGETWAGVPAKKILPK